MGVVFVLPPAKLLKSIVDGRNHYFITEKLIDYLQNNKLRKLAVIPYGEQAWVIEDSIPDDIQLEFFDRDPTLFAKSSDDINTETHPFVLISNIYYEEELRAFLFTKGYNEKNIITLRELVESSFHDEIDDDDTAKKIFYKQCILRNAKWISKRFDCFGDLTIAAPNQYVKYYERLLCDYEIVEFDKEALSFKHDNFVYMLGNYFQPKLIDNLSSAKRVYTINSNGHLCNCRPDQVDSYEYPDIDAHIFNKLGHKSPSGGYYYFPYGYLYRFTNLGPINAFGFRIDIDYRSLENRDVNHKVIAVFGGSAAWSYGCIYEEMFSYRLEVLLNDYCSRNKLPLKFTVLNFGMHAHVVMNEMLTYNLFCYQIKPDYTIAHDGFNDILYGLISDPFLLKKYDLTYSPILEEWSHILHGTHDIPTNQPSIPYKSLNLPQNILKAYLTRKYQFQEMVELQGGIYIWGFQPMLYSKKKLSTSEKVYRHCKAHEDLIPQIKFLYERFAKDVELPERVPILDFHQYFGQFGDDMTLFIDIVHTTPLGDEKVAEYYFTYLKNDIKKRYA